ncbi:MAG: PAS domain S-box protein [Acidobacteria bacterium]|nr:PAS domain S-box protein [Acidobacteriota bacterium]
MKHRVPKRRSGAPSDADSQFGNEASVAAASHPLLASRLRLLILCAAAAIPAALAGATQALPVLTQAKDLRALPAGESSTPRQVRLEGVVTDYDPEWNAFFLQDETGGVRVLPPSGRQDLQVGDRIEVEGIYRQSGLAPAIESKQIRVLGRAPLPGPLRAPPSQIVAGLRDSQWVEVSGIVRSGATERHHAIAEIASGDERIKVHLPAPGGGRFPEWLLDARIRVQGVCSVRLNSSQEFVEAVVFVPDSRLLVVEKPAPSNPWDAPPVPFPAVLSGRTDESIGHRVHVRGVVEMFRPGRSIFITDGGNNLYVQTSAQDPLQPGDRVDVLGFPELIQKGPAVVDAVYHRIGSGPPPLAVHVTPAEILAPRHDSGLVSIEGRLTQLSVLPDGPELTLQAGPHVFQAFLEPDAAAADRFAGLEENSVLRVTGVCILFRDNSGNPYGFKLRVRHVREIEVVQRPSWWTVGRALALLVLTSGAVFVAFAWVVALRRRVRSQTDVIRREHQSKAAVELRCYNLIENARDIICTLDLNGVLLTLNRAGEERSGYLRQEVVGQAISGMFAPESTGRLAEVLNCARRGEEPPAGEWEIIGKDGRRVWLEVSLRVINEMGTPVALEGIARDITERKRAEEEKRQLEVQLQQARKMESVGRLAGGVAHDFNNMLGVILGHTEIALEGVTPGHPVHADLVEIHAAAKRSADLTRQLLTFARKQTVEPRVLDLNGTIAGSLQMFGRLIGEDVRLHWRPGADLWAVKADPSQIDQILANLCVNARDAIAGVGTITIATGNGSLNEADCADLPGVEPGDYVRLEVGDDGCGMDDETLKQIFEPFFTTKGMGARTGLGLASVYGAVKQNGGHIEARSKPGAGTTFTIYLPRVPRQAEQAGAEGVAESRKRGHETILLVEDEPAILKMTTRVLQRSGYTVLAAGTPGEAIRLAGERGGEIHMLMTDVVMPEMNGRDLAKQLQSSYPGLKCLFMSGYTADVIARHGVVDEGISFIQKPFSIGDVAAKIRTTLDGE